AADGGEATKLTSHKSAVRAFEWTDDSTSIVFSAPVPKSDGARALEKAGDDAIVVDEGPNGQGRSDFTELWRTGISGKREEPITRADPPRPQSFRVPPDARKVAIIYRREGSRNGQFHAEIAIVDAATGRLTDVTHNNAPEQNVQWSHDGRMLS